MKLPTSNTMTKVGVAAFSAAYIGMSWLADPAAAAMRNTLFALMTLLIFAVSNSLRESAERDLDAHRRREQERSEAVIAESQRIIASLNSTPEARRETA